MCAIKFKLFKLKLSIKLIQFKFIERKFKLKQFIQFVLVEQFFKLFEFVIIVIQLFQLVLIPG